MKQRLAAILAGDVVGYTRLMRADEIATVAALDAARAVFREAIEGHDGRVVDMAGDSVLSIFDTASSAVRAALAVQKTLAAPPPDVPEERRMDFRIGVHLGEVIEKADGTIYGDGVNRAARLESLAPAGGVCLSAAVHDQVSDRIEETFADIGAHTVKNVDKPLHAYAWEASGAPPPAQTGEKGRLPVIAIGAFEASDETGKALGAGVADGVASALSSQTGFVLNADASAADYVASGRIQVLGARYRASLRLDDVKSGATFASDRFDGDLSDLFQAQDDLTYRVYGAIRYAIYMHVADMAGDESGSEPTTQSALAEAAMLMFRSDLASYLRARGILDALLAEEPENFMVLAMKAAGLMAEMNAGYRSIAVADGTAAVAAAREAVRLSPNSDYAYCVLSMVTLFCDLDYETARRAAQRSLEINPYVPLANGAMSQVLMFTGHIDQSIEIGLKAIEANMRGPGNAHFLRYMALAELVRGRYDAAIDWALRSDQLHAGAARTLLIMASAAAHAGDEATTARAVDRLTAAHPDFRLRDFGNWPFQDPEPAERLIAGLRRAGVPE